MNKIWYGWAHIPNGITCVKIERYNEKTKTCDITFSGSLTAVDFPMELVEPVYKSLLPWEKGEKDD